MARTHAQQDLGTGIRPYGPGKFDTVLDAYVYGVTLDGGCDDELVSSAGMSWYGLMRHGHTIFRDHDPLLETLNAEEQTQLTECAGVIVREDSDGFVAVRYYDSMMELDRDWNTLQEQIEADDEDC